MRQAPGKMVTEREGETGPGVGRPAEPGEITDLLRAWADGESDAFGRLAPQVYDRLHALAAATFRREGPGHTLQPTALVHEAMVRMLGDRPVAWRCRTHFFRIAARVMRRVLVDHARRRGRHKRGGRRVALRELQLVVEAPPVEVLALDRALDRLAAHDPDKASVVELRYFGGLTVEETATCLEVSVSTVVRQWRNARAWLLHELARPAGHGS